MGKIIIPGEYGIGTRGFTPTSDGYRSAAEALLREHNAGRQVNTSDPEIRRVLGFYNASSMQDLKVKFRGW